MAESTPAFQTHSTTNNNSGEKKPTTVDCSASAASADIANRANCELKALPSPSIALSTAIPTTSAPVNTVVSLPSLTPTQIVSLSDLLGQSCGGGPSGLSSQICTKIFPLTSASLHHPSSTTVLQCSESGVQPTLFTHGMVSSSIPSVLATKKGSDLLNCPRPLQTTAPVPGTTISSSPIPQVVSSVSSGSTWTSVGVRNCVGNAKLSQSTCGVTPCPNKANSVKTKLSKCRAQTVTSAKSSPCKTHSSKSVKLTNAVLAKQIPFAPKTTHIPQNGQSTASTNQTHQPTTLAQLPDLLKYTPTSTTKPSQPVLPYPSMPLTLLSPVRLPPPTTATKTAPNLFQGMIQPRLNGGATGIASPLQCSFYSENGEQVAVLWAPSPTAKPNNGNTPVSFIPITAIKTSGLWPISTNDEVSVNQATTITAKTQSSTAATTVMVQSNHPLNKSVNGVRPWNGNCIAHSTNSNLPSPLTCTATSSVVSSAAVTTTSLLPSTASITSGCKGKTKPLKPGGFELMVQNMTKDIHKTTHHYQEQSLGVVHRNRKNQSVVEVSTQTDSTNIDSVGSVSPLCNPMLTPVSQSDMSDDNDNYCPLSTELETDTDRVINNFNEKQPLDSGDSCFLTPESSSVTIKEEPTVEDCGLLPTTVKKEPEEMANTDQTITTVDDFGLSVFGVDDKLFGVSDQITENDLNEFFKALNSEGNGQLNSNSQIKNDELLRLLQTSQSNTLDMNLLVDEVPLNLTNSGVSLKEENCVQVTPKKQFFVPQMSTLFSNCQQYDLLPCVKSEEKLLQGTNLLSDKTELKLSNLKNDEHYSMYLNEDTKVVINDPVSQSIFLKGDTDTDQVDRNTTSTFFQSSQQSMDDPEDILCSSQHMEQSKLLSTCLDYPQFQSLYLDNDNSMEFVSNSNSLTSNNNRSTDSVSVSTTAVIPSVFLNTHFKDNTLASINLQESSSAENSMLDPLSSVSNYLTDDQLSNEILSKVQSFSEKDETLRTLPDLNISMNLNDELENLQLFHSKQTIVHHLPSSFFNQAVTTPTYSLSTPACSTVLDSNDLFNQMIGNDQYLFSNQPLSDSQFSQLFTKTNPLNNSSVSSQPSSQVTIPSTSGINSSDSQIEPEVVTDTLEVVIDDKQLIKLSIRNLNKDSNTDPDCVDRQIRTILTSLLRRMGLDVHESNFPVIDPKQVKQIRVQTTEAKNTTNSNLQNMLNGQAQRTVMNPSLKRPTENTGQSVIDGLVNDYMSSIKKSKVIKSPQSLSPLSMAILGAIETTTKSLANGDTGITPTTILNDILISPNSSPLKAKSRYVQDSTPKPVPSTNDNSLLKLMLAAPTKMSQSIDRVAPSLIKAPPGQSIKATLPHFNVIDRPKRCRPKKKLSNQCAQLSKNVVNEACTMSKFAHVSKKTTTIHKSTLSTLTETNPKPVVAKKSAPKVVTITAPTRVRIRKTKVTPKTMTIATTTVEPQQTSVSKPNSGNRILSTSPKCGSTKITVSICESSINNLSSGVSHPSPESLDTVGQRMFNDLSVTDLSPLAAL